MKAVRAIDCTCVAPFCVMVMKSWIETFRKDEPIMWNALKKLSTGEWQAWHWK